jgi:tetratricopeptide (TPR) repeat protein
LAAIASARMQYPLEEKYLNDWIKLEPDSTAAYTRLGRAQFMQKTEASAGLAYKTFQKLYDEVDKAKDPAKKVPRAEVNMAVLYTQDEKLANAKKLMDLAMSRAEPDDVNTRLAAAALKADPESLQAMLLMGITARYAKDYPNAETYFRKALAKAPSNFAAMNNLSIAMIDQPDEAKRRQALEYAQLNQRVNQDLNTPAGRESGATLAWVLFNMGNEADAENAAIRVLQSGSISNEAAYYLAKILSDRGRAKEAKQILEPLIKQPRFFPGKNEAKDVLARLGDAGDLEP